jgi:hypothetical protein
MSQIVTIERIDVKKFNIRIGDRPVILLSFWLGPSKTTRDGTHTFEVSKELRDFLRELLICASRPGDRIRLQRYSIEVTKKDILLPAEKIALTRLCYLSPRNGWMFQGNMSILLQT